MILPIRSAASTSKSITPTVSSIDHCCPIDDIGRNHASRKAIERSTTSGSINLPIWRAPRAGPGSSQWISLNLNPSVRLVKHLLKVPTQKEASEGRSRRISGQPRPISANLGQSRPISANLGQPRPTSADLGQPRPISASLGHPRPPLAHAPTTSAHAPNNHGPRANLLSVVDGGPIECPPAIASGNAPVESGVISDRSIRPNRTRPTSSAAVSQTLRHAGRRVRD